MKKGPLPPGSTKLMKKVGPFLSGLVFWCLPLSGPTSTMTKTGLLLYGSVNSTKKRGPLVSDMKKKKGLVVSEMEGLTNRGLGV